MHAYYCTGLRYGPDDLQHHGIKGQRWGIRRFQNEDGSYTEAGKQRYGKEGLEQESRKKKFDGEKAKKIAKVVGVAAGTAALAYGGYKLGTSDFAREMIEKVTVNGSRIKDSVFAYKFDPDVLDAKIGRLKKEAELRQLTYESITKSANPRTQMYMDAGRKVATTVLSGAGLYGIKMLLTKKLNPVDAAGYIAPKPKNK